MRRPSWIIWLLAKEPYASCLALPYSFFRKPLTIGVLANGNAPSWPSSEALPNQGSVPPPELPGFLGTMGPSDFHNGPRLAISDHPGWWLRPTTAMDLARCLEGLLRMLTPLPRLERTGSSVGCSPTPDGLPLLAAGSAPARNYRGLLRVHVLFGLRICTLVTPRTSPEASAGRLLASTAPVATGRTDNSPDGTCTRWSSRPRRSLRQTELLSSPQTSFRAALPDS
jgi:hypothetical protein